MGRRTTSPRRCMQPGIIVKNTFIDVCDEQSESDLDTRSSPHRRNVSAPPSPTRPRRGEDSDEEEVDDDPNAIPCYQWAADGQQICPELAEASLPRRPSDFSSPRGGQKWPALASPKKIVMKGGPAGASLGPGLGAIFNMEPLDEKPMSAPPPPPEEEEEEREEQAGNDPIFKPAAWPDFGSEDFEGMQYYGQYHDAPAAPPGTFYKDGGGWCAGGPMLGSRPPQDASARTVPPYYMPHRDGVGPPAPPYDPYMDQPAPPNMSGPAPSWSGYPAPDVMYRHERPMESLPPRGGWHPGETAPPSMPPQAAPAPQQSPDIWSEGQRRLSELRARGRMLQEAACIPGISGTSGARGGDRLARPNAGAPPSWAAGKSATRQPAPSAQAPTPFGGPPHAWGPSRKDGDGGMARKGGGAKAKRQWPAQPPLAAPGGAAPPPFRVGLVDAAFGGTVPQMGR